jgi:predicted  nucleic acid-binding Zn-ribbon protein
MPAQPIVRSRPKVEFTPQSDCAAAALEMVAEVAAAIRQAKEQSGQEVAQATELADSIVKKLETAEARADYAETALRNAEGEATEWAAAATKAVEDLEIAQQQLSAKEEQLAAAERRLRYTQKKLRDAENRFTEANSAIELPLWKLFGRRFRVESVWPEHNYADRNGAPSSELRAQAMRLKIVPNRKRTVDVSV